MLTKELANEFIQKIQDDHSVTCWHTFATDSRYIWAIVFGWLDDDKAIGVKVAYCPRNSAMNEYDYDWIMPYDAETGDVDDTETVVYPDEDEANIAYLNKVAQRFMDEYVDKYVEGKL